MTTTKPQSTTEPIKAPERVKLWICCHCQAPRMAGLTVCERCGKKLHDVVEYIRSPANVAPVVDANEVMRQIRDKLINGNPATLIEDIAKLVEPKQEGESKCEHGVPWSMECLSCGPSDYAAATAAPPVDAETFVKQWIATLQDESHVTDEDAEDLVFRIIAYKNTAAAPVEQSDQEPHIPTSLTGINCAYSRHGYCDKQDCDCSCHINEEAR